MWSSETGTYLGYFGQPQQFDLRSPSGCATPFPATLPYDITEGPQSPERKIRESVRIQEREEARHLIEYPLVFDAQRWIPFRRSAYLKNRGVGRIASNLVASSNRKFFEALKKSSVSRITYSLLLLTDRHPLCYLCACVISVLSQCYLRVISVLSPCYLCVTESVQSLCLCNLCVIVSDIFDVMFVVVFSEIIDVIVSCYRDMFLVIVVFIILFHYS